MTPQDEKRTVQVRLQEGLKSLALAQECAEVIGCQIHKAAGGKLTPVMLVDHIEGEFGYTVDIVTSPQQVGTIIGLLVASLLEVEEREADAKDASRN